MVKRKGAEGKIFVSCSNYPACDYSASNLESVRENNRCPVCNNFLTKRNGKFGEFLGCMSYPYCTYSSDIVVEPRNLEGKKAEQNRKILAYVKKDRDYNSTWTLAEDTQLKAEYTEKMPIAQIAQRHNKTSGQIVYRLRKLGLLE